MPFENGNTYGKTSKRGASKNTIVIKEYLEKICNELIKDMNLGKLTNTQRIILVLPMTVTLKMLLQKVLMIIMI
jgi:hypothetical protein